ncbi:unnamed protein product [Rotaria socialis]|uniref:Uncharacterized protein n=3 Tax=Rotaria socialis TaxID=392032 RepID=A0A817YIG0_9BILA|nr:unnamed protein product [Rotaria socialis]CAF4830569.1 unnamed protein product [Rotaria socialis]
MSAQLFYLQGLILDNYGNSYVANSSNHWIQMFCPGAVFGITIAGTGQAGQGDSELKFPYDVAFDSEMNLYVANTWNNHIQILKEFIELNKLMIFYLLMNYFCKDIIKENTYIRIQRIIL